MLMSFPWNRSTDVVEAEILTANAEVKALLRWMRESRTVELANELSIDADTHFVSDHFHRHVIPLVGLEIIVEPPGSSASHGLNFVLESWIGSLVDPLQIHQPSLVVGQRYRLESNTQSHDMSRVNRLLGRVVEHNAESLRAVETERELQHDVVEVFPNFENSGVMVALFFASGEKTVL